MKAWQAWQARQDREIGREIAQQREEKVVTEKKKIEDKPPVRIEAPVLDIPLSPKVTKPVQQSLFAAPGDDTLPGLPLLAAPKEQGEPVSAETVEYTSRLIERKLADFGVDVKVVAAYPGPVITRYEIEPATGVKGSQVVGLARGVIAEAFSNKVITPGVTTTDDVVWYIRERFEQLDLPVWFTPSVSLQRAGTSCQADSPFCGSSGIIQRGDALHTDVGICYLKLCTDTQEMAYVLNHGEADVPAGLKQALATGNRWQDLLTNEFRVGRSGNEVLSATHKAAAKAKINHSTYTHALGFVGHAPGPTIGMWDNQGPTAVQGDWPLYANTAYAIEGNIKQALPEWQKQLIQIKLEQSAYFDGKQVIYLAGRQIVWHLVH